MKVVGKLHYLIKLNDQRIRKCQVNQLRAIDQNIEAHAMKHICHIVHSLITEELNRSQT